MVGGGNTAVEEAMFLTNFATKVTVIHRRDHFRAERILQDRLFKNPKIKVIWDSAIEEIRGDENPRKVTGVAHPERQDRRHHDASDRRRVHRDRPRAGDGACHRPGQDEAVGLRRDRAAFDRDVGRRGVFAAGDVADETYRQAVTAAGLGCMAALEAERFLALHATERAAAE